MKRIILLILSFLFISYSFAQQKVKSESVVNITNLQRTIDSLKAEQLKQKQNYDKLEANALKTIEETKLYASAFSWVLTLLMVFLTIILALVMIINLLDRKKLGKIEGEFVEKIKLNFNDEMMKFKEKYKDEIKIINDTTLAVFKDTVNKMFEEKIKDFDSFLIRSASNAVTGFEKTFEDKLDEYKSRTINDITSAISSLLKDTSDKEKS